MVAVYEAEWTIGVGAPAPLDVVVTGCNIIRQWIQREYGADAAEAARINLTSYGQNKGEWTWFDDVEMVEILGE